jgi:spermidine synthase
MSTKLPATTVRQLHLVFIRWGIYTCFFLSGATALLFEMLWSRQFVTVFGNSSYAISIVLCAYMAGLGLGGLFGGWLADLVTQRAVLYGAAVAIVTIWAMAIPTLLDWLRVIVPTLVSLSPDSLLVSTLARFGLSFAILLVPCFLMGTTLPMLVRAVTESDRQIGSRIGVLYCLNTLGAALGCLAAGFWMLETLGLRQTNLAAVGINIVIVIGTIALSKPLAGAIASASANTDRAKSTAPVQPNQANDSQVSSRMLLIAAFLNGLAALACEVLWIRYLAFLGHSAYVFPTILCIYLLGMGVGGLIYSLFAGRIRRPAIALGIVEAMLGLSVPALFITSAMVFAGGPPPMKLEMMALIIVTLPAVLMGIAFPLLCAVYGNKIVTLGRRIGLLYAVNTAGTVLGAILPIFVLVPFLGIQKSIMLISVIYGVMAIAILRASAKSNLFLTMGTAVAYAGALLFMFAEVPNNLCQQVFFATDFELARHTDILFYREGRTGTAIVTRNRVDNSRTLYIDGTNEVPLFYAHRLCFKMIGDLGPMLQSDPQNVLMICFGGGIASGATTQLPEVKHLAIVDLESSVVEAAKLFSEENNELLSNPKAHVVIDDGRNYIMMSRRKWPVIISDSTHPKSGDSWVLYSQQFYRQVQGHLTDDGVFVQWIPMHGLRAEEFKIIIRTFQSVFPHSVLWITQGAGEQGRMGIYTLLAGMPAPLKIDVGKLRDRLDAEAVRHDLEPFALNTPAGFLDLFLCAEDVLRKWAGDGPVNTDDLPFTYYETEYSKGVLFNPARLIEVGEDIWPYLTNTGNEQQAKQLREEIALRVKANRLALTGQIEKAHALLPDDIRYRQMRELNRQVLPNLQKLASIYRDNPKVLDYLARTAGSYQAAVPIYEQVLKLDPKNIQALNILGVMNIKAGNLQVAEDYLRRAVRLQSNCGSARYNLGHLLEQTGRHAEAVEQWEKAAKTQNDERAADYWGQFLVGQGRAKDAIQWFRVALNIRPEFTDARFHLIGALYQTGNTQEALTHLEYILKIDPQNEKAIDIKARIQDMDKAGPQDKSGQPTVPAADGPKD